MICNILFIVRIDAAVKGGGDLIQAKRYKKELELNRKIKVSFAHDVTDYTLSSVTWDYVQLFNYSRIPEHHYYLDTLKYKKIGLCTIIQPGYQISKIDRVKSFIRGILSFKIINTFKVDIDKTITSLDVIFYLSDKEMFYFKTIHDDLPEGIVVHNGVDRVTETKKNINKYDFIVVGRIEKGKNSIRILDFVAKNYPDKSLIFVGAVNKFHIFFYLKFLFSIVRHKNIRYFGFMNRDRTLHLISQSEILLNLSLKEVSPLVDLEGISCGTKILTTKQSFTHLVNDNDVVFASPYNYSEWSPAIDFLVDSPKESNCQARAWSDCLKDYVVAIERLTL